MLNAMRFGNLESEIIKRFRELDRPVKYDDGLSPTELYVLMVYDVYILLISTYCIHQLPHTIRG